MLDNIFDNNSKKPKYNKILLENIKEAIDIVSLLENEYGLILESSANGWFKTNCPLPGHRDSDPSFGIKPETGQFSCLGCGFKGDVFSFVQKIDGVSFPESIRRLKILAGISDNPDESEVFRAVRDIQLATNEYLNRHAEYNLPGGISPVLFMVSLSNRLRQHEEKVEHDPDEISWIDSVYKEVDELELQDDHKGLTRTWNNIGREINERYGTWKSRTADNTN